MGALTLIPSSPTSSEASQIIPTLNALIQRMNVAYGNGGAGNTSQGLAVASVTAPINLLQITPGTSAAPAVVLAAIGASTDINLTLSTKGAGTLQVGTAGMVAANGSVATAITSLGPTNSRSNIQQWLRLLDSTGASFFIPMW